MPHDIVRFAVGITNTRTHMIIAGIDAGFLGNCVNDKYAE
jgi:hypothetical protein